jgi:hypothetical protein
MKKHGILLAAVLLLPAIIFVPQQGKALYIFAAKEGTRCSTCHVNPTGGMIRTQVGIDYAQNDHSFQEQENSAPLLSFIMGENLQAGSDMRFMYNYNDSTELPSYQSRSSFFTMQGALYLSANLGKNLVLFYNNDFGFAGLGQNREVWGMLRKLAYNGYLKVGRFRLPYGIRMDDHTSFVKDSLGFGTHSQDNGIEVGFTPATFYTYLALTNGEEHYVPFDRNTYKAFTASAGFIIRHLSFGGSFYFNRSSIGVQEKQRVGAYGSLYFNRVTLLAEADYGWDDSLKGFVPPSRELLAGYAQALYQLFPTLRMTAKFDYWDPHRGMQDDDIQRVTVGGDLYLFKLSELKLQYRINLEESKEKNNEFLSQVHFFF